MSRRARTKVNYCQDSDSDSDFTEPVAKKRETRDPRPSREERQLNREMEQAISASRQETASNKENNSDCDDLWTGGDGYSSTDSDSPPAVKKPERAASSITRTKRKPKKSSVGDGVPPGNTRKTAVRKAPALARVTEEGSCVETEANLTRASVTGTCIIAHHAAAVAEIATGAAPTASTCTASSHDMQHNRPPPALKASRAGNHKPMVPKRVGMGAGVAVGVASSSPVCCSPSSTSRIRVGLSRNAKVKPLHRV